MNPEQVPAQFTTSSDGTPIAWYDFGGTGPDVLLAHATGFCAQVWAPVVETLLHRFHLVGYDTRGHGLSGRPDRGQAGWEWSLFAADALAVIQAAGLVNVLGIGHSSGGAAEVLLEEAQPGTFRSLYLFEPVIFPVDPPTGPDPDRDLAVRARKRRPSFESRFEAITAFTERGPFVHMNRRALENYVDFGFEAQPDGSVTLRLQPDDEAEIYVMASNHDGFSHLDAVKCPVALARGARSLAFSKDEVAAIGSRLPDVETFEIKGLTHFGPLEKSQMFAQMAADWFDQ